MRRTIRWIGNAAVETATRVWTDAPVSVLFLFAVVGYLVLCIAVYPGSQR